MSPHSNAEAIQQPTGGDRHQAGDSNVNRVALARFHEASRPDSATANAFSAMDNNLTNDAVGKLFGNNFSIVDKQGNEARQVNGDHDGQSIADIKGYTNGNALEPLDAKIAKAQQPLPGAENTAMAARISRSPLPSEHKDAAVRAERNKKAEKSNTKRDRSNSVAENSYKEKYTDKHESSLTHSGSFIKQPEQKAHAIEQQIHKIEPKANKVESKSHAIEPKSQPSEQKVHKPEQPANKTEAAEVHKTETKVSHKSESTNHKPETSAVRNPETTVSPKTDNTAVHKSEATAVRNSETKAHQKPETPALQKPETKAIQKPEIATVQKAEATAIHKPENIAAHKLDITPIHKSDVAATERVNHTNINVPLAKEIKFQQSDKPVAENNIHQVHSQSSLESGPLKTIDAKAETKVEHSVKEERNEKSIARDDRDDDILDLHERQALHNAGQDLAHVHNAHTEISNSNNSNFDLSAHTALAKSTSSEHIHNVEPSKIHTINHIVSSLDGRQGKIDSIRIAHDPEVQTNHKSTGGGNTTTSTTTTTASGSTHKDHSPAGHAGTNTGTGHGAGHPPAKTDPNAPSNNGQSTNQSAAPCAPTTTVQPSNGPVNIPVANNGYTGPIVVERPSKNVIGQAAYLLELLAEIGFMAGMNSHNAGRKLAISSRPRDINDPAIPGNIVSAQPASNQSNNPLINASNIQPGEQTIFPSNLSDSVNPANSANNTAPNLPVENNNGLGLNPVVSEPVSVPGPVGGLNGKIPSGANGNGVDGQAPAGFNNPGFELQGSPAVDPTFSGSPGGQLGANPGANPAANGNPYLTGSLDYWGGGPASNSSTPGNGFNATPPLSDEGWNNRSPLSGEADYSEHLQSEKTQPGDMPLLGEINNKSDFDIHSLEKSTNRAEISDAWQALNLEHGLHAEAHHLHHHADPSQANQLDHNHSLHHHDLQSLEQWLEQNHSRKHANTHKGLEPSHKNDRLPPIKNEILIGQLIGLIDDGKNKDPKQEPKVYIVKEGDTLESIATDMLFDSRLGLLIYIINKTALPSVSDWRQCQLLEGLVLFLPIDEEIRSFRLALGLPVNGQMTNENIEHKTVRNLVERRFNVERLLGSIKTISNNQPKSCSGREQLTVRLGDTLRSIALKHSSLHDVSLWKLLAQLNELSVAVDSKGVPIAILTRGMVLQLPTTDEIVEYRTQQSAQRRSTSPRKALQNEILSESTLASKC